MTHGGPRSSTIAIKFGQGDSRHPAYVLQPEGNGIAERTIRMLQEQLLWVRIIATVEELPLGLTTIASQYNEAWLRQRHGHKTPIKSAPSSADLRPMSLRD